jgi:hypothetical protein
MHDHLAAFLFFYSYFLPCIASTKVSHLNDSFTKEQRREPYIYTCDAAEVEPVYMHKKGQVAEHFLGQKINLLICVENRAEVNKGTYQFWIKQCV